MKSAVWLPGARRDCQAFVVGTKVVVQPVCSHTYIQAVPGRRPHIRCDGALEWSLKWTRRSNVVNDVRTSVKTLLKSSNDMRPSPRSHASNVIEGVRQCKTAVDRGWPRCTAWVWMLLKSINARFLIPYRPQRSNAAEGYGQRSNAVDHWWRLNTCENVSENAALILDCWQLHTAERFGTVCRIVSRYFVQYRIVSIVFPHDHIVPSLKVCMQVG